jgi:LPXTG-motif cell wall-anchored protein
MQAIIDFEDGLAPGDIVSSLSAGQGITGEDFGTVGVIGTRSDLPDVNQAMIFDAACGGAAASCSGEDLDLYQPQLGNVLIISEDGDSGDPDDADVGEQIDFDFSSWGSGVVTVLSIDVLDVEVDESPGLIAVGAGSVPIPDIGDGNVSTIPIGLSGSSMSVILNGSGAIDNIVIEFEPAPPATSEPPPTTAPPVDTTPPATEPPATTAPPAPTQPPGPPTTSVDQVPVAPSTPPTSITELPETGWGATSAAAMAAGLLALGVAFLVLARRPTS